MPNSEPVVEFVKGSVEAASGTRAAMSKANVNTALGSAWGISYDKPAGGQDGNWMNKSAQCPGETNKWATAPGNTAPEPAVDSGIGFIADNGDRDIIRTGGNVSRPMNVLISNNRTAAIEIAVAENCKLRVYDYPGATTQTREPISADGPPNHGYWLLAEQFNNWVHDGVDFEVDVAGAAPDYGIYGTALCIGSGVTNPLDGGNPPTQAVDLEPWNWTVLGGDAYDLARPYGCGILPVGSITNLWLGQEDGGSIAAAPGGAIDVCLQLMIPTTASAQVHKFALALEYTFVV